MQAILTLFQPLFNSARNHAFHRKSFKQVLKALPFVVMTIAFWAVLFGVSAYILNSFYKTEVVGELLVSKLMSLIFVTVFFALIFSNIITSLSTFFLSEDLQLILVSPLSALSVFYQRFILTLFHSSWMVLIFLIPVLAAYGYIFTPGWEYYLALLLMLFGLMLICSAGGVIITFVLVNIFPARRTMDLLMLLAVVGFSGLYVMFRVAGPEQLINPDEFTSLKDYFIAFQVPTSIFLPNYWCTRILMPLLVKSPGESWFYMKMLYLSAAVGAIVASWIFEASYFNAWTKSQESNPRSIFVRNIADKALDSIMRIVRQPFRELALKDIKFFFRDASQWSQLLLLAALVVVYLYNFKPLGSLKNIPFASFWIEYLVIFANLGLAGLITSAVALRFVFPAVSLEGRAMWILKSAPVSITRLVLSKYIIALVPLLSLSLTLIIFSNRMLEVSSFIMGVTLCALIMVVCAIVAMGIAFGTAFPRFKEENVAKIASSYGGVIYMVSCVIFLVIEVGLIGWPSFIIDSQVPWTHNLLTKMSIAYTIAITLNVFMILFPLWFGIRAIENLEI